MGTTLTGTTPQDTYDSLIKVTDNGPLTGSLKKLTDGLGNDSSLSLSTAAASFSGTLDVTGNAAFDTSTLFIDAANNRVGIGTATPASRLDVSGGNIHSFYSYVGDTANYNLRVGNDLDATQFGYLLQLGGSTFLTNNAYYASAGQFDPTATAASLISLEGGSVIVFGNTGLTAGTNYTPTERARFTPNGLTFNGDTAAANALDDYEEGTWTPSVVGGTSGEATYAARNGYYTKIGRQVTVVFSIAFQKNTMVGFVTLSGLPFVNANLTSNLPQSAILIDNLLSAYDNPILQLTQNSASGILLIDNGSTTAHGILPSTQLGLGTMDFRGTATYFV